RIDAAAARGERSAKRVQQALKHLDLYISGTQLGITLASLSLGWIGESTVAELLDRLFAQFGYTVSPALTHSAAAVTTAFIVITFLHIVLGELAPKSIALVNPERVSRIVVQPLRLFSRVMRPFIAILNGAANGILRLGGLHTVQDSARVHSPEELRLLVMQTRAHGLLNETDSQMLAGVFDFHNKKARDVMRPRIEVAAIPIEATEAEVREILRRERYSRYPVYHETLDDVVGIFLAKDLWLHEGAEPFSLRGAVREALYLPDTRAAERVLDDLRRTRAHMAVVLDEFGGTAGIITVEDLVEEVMGDIVDEYDIATREVLEQNGVL